MKTADEILSMVNEFLANLPYERKPKSLYEPIRYVLSMGDIIFIFDVFCRGVQVLKV